MSDMSAGAPSPEQPPKVPQTPMSEGEIMARKRRRGHRGGSNRSRSTAVELPDPPREAKMYNLETGTEALVRKPQIGDTRPAPVVPVSPSTTPSRAEAVPDGEPASGNPAAGNRTKQKGRRGNRRGGKNRRGRGERTDKETTPINSDADLIERRRGKERNGRPLGRYFMCVQVRPEFTQVAMLEGRSLIEHYVSRPADDDEQIHGNIYLGRVQNVLPGMEAAFVDIGTPKNAVLYRGDVQFDKEDVVEQGPDPRIEHVLKARQLILCQVTKNPIGAKGGRLTQEVSLPGRFVVLIPDSRTYGISKRLPDNERRRLRAILDRIKPEEHGIIVRTASVHATEQELSTDLTRLLAQWEAIKEKSKKANSPTLLYREPPLAVRVIREEFSSDYRGVTIDDETLYNEVRDYIQA
ncbi:MAG: ribonuclease E/G, partial [Ilumatobacteraceae bacterium]